VPGGGAGARVRRGGARDALVRAAQELVAEATLDDLTAFITVSRLKERTGLSSGAIYSAFSPSAGVGARARSAPQAVARRGVLATPDHRDDELTLRVVQTLAELVGAAAEGDGLLVDAIADRVAEAVMAAARGEMAGQYTHTWIAAAVSLHDPEVAAALEEAYGRYRQWYAALIAELLALSGREPADGLDLETLADLLVTVADGTAMRVRFDRGLDERFISTAIVACWAGATRRRGVTDELLGHRIAVPTSHAADAAELEAIEAAVRRVRERAGWPAVTLHKVAQLAGTSDSRLAGLFPTRDHLARLLWEPIVDRLVRRSGARSGAPVEELVHDLADAVCSERTLVASLLRVRLATQDLDDRAADPAERPADLLAEALPADVDARREVAAHVVDGMLLRAACSSVSADDLARSVLVELDGLC
jgi:hypothetical protein